MSEPSRTDSWEYLSPEEPTGFYECKDCCIQWTDAEHEHCCPVCYGSRYFEISSEEYQDGY